MDTLIDASRLLVAAASTSLREAGEHLGLDKAKTSRLLAALEERTGLVLADRTTRPAKLTPAAERILPDCRLLLRAAGRLEAAREAPERTLRHQEGPMTRIRVSLASNMAVGPMLSLFARFEAKHAVRIEVLKDCGIGGLLERRADLAWFGFVPDPAEGLAVFSNGLSYSFLMASRTYVRHFGVPETVEDLRNHRILMRDTGNGSFETELECGERTFVIDEGFQCRQECADMCRERLLAGEGIAMDLTPGFVMDALASGSVVPVLKGWHRRPWPLTLATLPHLSRNPVLLELVDAIILQTNAVGGLNDWRFWYRRFGIPAPVVS